MEPIAGDAVVLVNELVRLAVSQRASDIHLEPKHDMMHVRLRVDGALVDVQPIALSVAPNVVSRVKVLAKMDIAERRLPQDGQIAIDLDGPGAGAGSKPAAPMRVQLRVSTFPASQGEKVVLRILSSQQIIPFEQLGLEAAAQATMRDVLGRPQGFVVTSGPTGAGKTSTLYALMQLIDPKLVNVVTLEDPIEVELYGLTQGQVNVRTGFTFATGLRAILRQDPDVILVGEMRDSETAGIAMQAALTGHLVLVDAAHVGHRRDDRAPRRPRGRAVDRRERALGGARAASRSRRVPALQEAGEAREGPLGRRRAAPDRGDGHREDQGLRQVHAHRIPRKDGDLRGRGAGRRPARAREGEGPGPRLPGDLPAAEDPEPPPGWVPEDPGGRDDGR